VQPFGTERVEREEGFARLFTDVEEVAELSDGFAFKFPNRDSCITRIVNVIVAERKCCPFFRFTLTFEPDGGPVWLHVLGSSEVKTFIGEQVIPTHLRPSA